ncbi:glycogen/starch synthase [Syntrophus aciditrophicus]|uniref:starch synthase n=1 Tax=Syntrophus aciditrophicus (strain SB) TaxID=56780 RepID=Q2LSY2_SYNAS|nr:glycogen/starch synthase [Syntrophus aciditrophicus]ABC77194.1 alpha-amylase [Syntrophus aciditrophicus SB]
MSSVIFYFQLHQPLRLHPDRDKFLWDEENREIFLKASERSYIPAIGMFTDLIRNHPGFRITLSMSGTFLEQAQTYHPSLIQALRSLLDAGKESQQVEFLCETYYHSLASLFNDPHKQEFRDQVSLHREAIRKLFGIFPLSFRNTELIYNNSIADIVADMGYVSILCEPRENSHMGAGTGSISPNSVFRARGTHLVVIPRNIALSNDVAFRFSSHPLTPEEYAASIARGDGEVILLGYDLEHIGGHIREEKGIFDFWRGLPAALEQYPDLLVETPTSVATRFKDAPLPSLDISGLSTSSWLDVIRNTFGWLESAAQFELFKDMEGMEGVARRAGGELLTRWRNLTASDHIYYLKDRSMDEHVLCRYENPYERSTIRATQILTRKIDYLEMFIKRFEILKRTEKTPILLITPETGRLPFDMGMLAKYISGKSGGQGEVVSALCEGLLERGIDVHLATLNLKKRFQMESQMTESQWREIRYKIDPENIHLVSSAIFADNLSAYSGDPLRTAAEFQREIVNNILKIVRSKHEGRLIIHSHDWMAGGAITAYAKLTDVPVLHTVHNVFTENLPLDLLSGINLSGISDYLYYSEAYGQPCIDCQATAIKNATIINFVGKQFLREVVEDYFLDRPLVPLSVRNEVKAKYFNDAARAIINAPASSMYPENCPFLIRKYGLDDPILQAKRENLVAFQQRTGLNVNPDAILFYWPSRLDPVQKGIELLEAIAQKFVTAYPDAQIAIVGDGIGSDRTHVEIFGRIAYGSEGKIAYHRFDEALSMLGFAAANDVFGASLYEPCGQIDQVGNLFGATATNRDTGGYHDKITELRLKMDGAPQDVGNGFLFRDYDPGGLWYGLEKSIKFHRKPPAVREAQIRRIMRQCREKYDLQTMIAQYIRIYEKLNGGKPLG